ncbi:uncharacterized protein LOC135705858 [Ochlerotatus camptorhynchus]|uniref:uncharacterized protein LOC135705858 n=1 Tax=Ochlerotatus camptorhynchus TaxID=644619 RepID=UPI0031D6DD50
MNMMKMCSFCHLPADLVCSRCLEVYCSFVCQIRDWSEHRRTCVDIPKLYPADSYLEVLAGGVMLPPRNSVTTERTSRKLLANNGRSLTPLRRPHFHMGPVGASVNRDVKGLPSEPTEKARNITVTMESEQRMVKIKAKDSYQKNAIEDLRPAECAANTPQMSAKLKLEMLKQHKKVDKADRVVESTNKQCKTWMLHFPLEKSEGEMFGVVVQCVPADQPKRCWVILADHETQCDKLLRDINGQVNPEGKSIRYDDILVDDIYTAPYEGFYYRVVILEKIDSVKSLVKIRLIDYGNELILPTADLRAPLPLMKNLRAFAFLIEIQNLNRPLELTEVIRIIIIRSESDRKIVDMDQTRLSLLHWLGNTTVGEGRIVATFSSRKALVLLASEPTMPIIKNLHTQLPKVATMFPLADNSKVGDLVCVELSEVGWSRAMIIEQHEGYRLVFTIDNGTMELVRAQDVRRLPEKYKHKPWLVLKMDVGKVVTNELDFKRMCYMPSFEFTFERLSYKKALQKMKCTMKDSEGKRILAEVDFMDFECDLKKAGLNFWPHIPQDKSIVRISFTFDVSTIVVCPRDIINIYTGLLQTVLPTLKRLTTAPNVKDVIVAVDDLMIPYRALVLSNVSTTEVELLDLDSGNITKTVLQKLFESNGFVNNLPVYTVKVHILDMNVSAIKDQACVLDQLDAFRSEQREFRMQFEGGSYIYGVKLLDVNTNRSLATILSEHHDKKVREVEQAVTHKREHETEQVVAEGHEQDRKTHEDRQMTEVSVALAVFTINDLKLVALPVGKSGVKLTILDDGALAQGLLTVCELTEENIKRYTTLIDEVNRVAATCGGDGYCPKLDELCIAVFDDDKMWYRAVCLQTQPAKHAFVVQLIDYGNMTLVKRESIRSLPEELAFPCAAHTCTIKDTKNVVETLTRQQATLGYVVAHEIQFERDTYSLSF